MKKVLLLLVILFTINILNAENYAFVIGCYDYEENSGLQDLETVEKDVKVITNILKRDYGFKIDSGQAYLNITREQFFERMSFFEENLKAEDNLLIYYGGHGEMDKDTKDGFWLFSDSKATSKANWISNATLKDYIINILAKHILVVTDSCYSGTLMNRGGEKIVSKFDSKKDRYLTLLKLEQKKSVTFLASGGKEPVNDGLGKDGHSVFATAFIETLSEHDKKGLFSCKEIDGDIFKKVQKWTAGNPQEPKYGAIPLSGAQNADAGGQFIFKGKFFDKNLANNLQHQLKPKTKNIQIVEYDNKQVKTVSNNKQDADINKSFFNIDKLLKFMYEYKIWNMIIIIIVVFIVFIIFILIDKYKKSSSKGNFFIFTLDKQPIGCLLLSVLLGLLFLLDVLSTLNIIKIKNWKNNSREQVHRTVEKQKLQEPIKKPVFIKTVNVTSSFDINNAKIQMNKNAKELQNIVDKVNNIYNNLLRNYQSDYNRAKSKIERLNKDIGRYKEKISSEKYKMANDGIKYGVKTFKKSSRSSDRSYERKVASSFKKIDGYEKKIGGYNRELEQEESVIQNIENNMYNENSVQREIEKFNYFYHEIDKIINAAINANIELTKPYIPDFPKQPNFDSIQNNSSSRRTSGSSWNSRKSSGRGMVGRRR